MSLNDVKTYYNKIANEYDKSRFENSYGSFIDRQERYFLHSHLKKTGTILSLGCGTGRFMEYATCGTDFSDEMIQIAKKNYPTKEFILASANDLPYEDNSIDAIFCFHVIMHLPEHYLKEILVEVFRVLKPGGQFVFDFPSANRRKKTSYNAANWHGASSYTIKQIKSFTKNYFANQKFRGFIFHPIHRIPVIFRPLVYPVDQLLNFSPLKTYSSYIAFSGIKKKLVHD